MESRSNAIAAGVFVIALSVGLVLVALWFTSENLDRTRYVVFSKMPVSGLRAKAAVRLRGVEVGKVASIVFDAQDPRVVLVNIDVDRSATLTHGTYGQLSYQGVTGLSFVELDDDGSDPQRLTTSADQPGRIELRPSLLDQIGGSGQNLLVDASLVAKRLNRLLSDENLSHLAGALRNAASAGEQIAVLAADLQPAARSLQSLETKSDATVVQLNLLLGDMRSVTAEFGRHLAALDEVGKGAQAVGAASRSLETAIVGDTLPRLSGAIDDFSRTSRNLDRVLRAVQEQPQSLLFGRRSPPPGPGEPGFAPPARAQ
ncbi:Mammalian cell entry related protein [Burkholderiales bacterium]|nr:Mammalian cell entry related protein [Burkholderiales bacterium]